ncbi:MAG: FtsX-like permease family protein [Actinomycetota bacterium]
MRGFLAVLRRLNVRHLRTRWGRSLLTIAGIAAGVTLVVSIAVINQTIARATRDSIRFLAGEAEIEVASAGQKGLPEETVDVVASVPGVERAVPLVRTNTTLTSATGEQRALILGATAEFAALFPQALRDQAAVQIQGTLGVEGTGILLSETVADRLEVDLGDPIAVSTPVGRKVLEVTGRVSGPGIDLVNAGEIAAMALPSAQATFGKTGEVDSIYLILRDDFSAEELSREIEERLSGAAVVGPPGERGRGFEETFNGIGTLTSLAGTVALFVALFVVYNSMSISLAERRRELSMALAMGARRRVVLGGFLAEATVFGVIASFLGVAAGIGLALGLMSTAVDQYSLIPVVASGRPVISAAALLPGFLGGIVVAWVGTLVPARRILSLAPIEALRPEAQQEIWRPRGSRFGARGATTTAIVLGAAGIGGMVVYNRRPVLAIATASVLCLLAGFTVLLPRLVPAVIARGRTALDRFLGPLGRFSIDGLLKNPARTSITVGALVFTLGLVIAAGATLGSFEAQFVRFANRWYSPPLYVGSETYRTLYSDQRLAGDFEKKLEEVAGVAHVFPFRYGAIDIGGGQAVFYITPASGAARSYLLRAVSVGGTEPEPLAEALQRGELLVSHYMAERRELEVGDELDLPTPAGRRSFRVGGLFYDLSTFESLYMGMATFRRHWDDDEADRFAIVPERGVKARELKTRLEDFVEAESIPAEVLTREELVGDVLKTVQNLFAIARGIQLAALIVAALTIANALFTGVLERRWEFGLQRAVGMSRSQLGRTVLLESMGIAILGAAGAIALGTLLGFLMLETQKAVYLMRIPFEIPWRFYGLALAGAVVLGALASVHPRRVALKAPIIESLRYE